ncbi:hypothetical protein ElyMa_000802900 [Elysia marginata]|uniref:Uncharacterized protein n=1 Tax=Elysia marginata TaxID=1093978 RepID=A0AAV4GX41_9GAST|nr:hypothetical protein ElyMa_000802900 [Elysia marginata]
MQFLMCILDNYQDSPKIPTADGRRGLLTADKALNGTSYFRNFYITPQELFFTNTPDMSQNTVIRTFFAEGTTLNFLGQGAGRVRLRYPIFPLHVEGSAIWKELQVVKMKLDTTKSEMQHAGMYCLNMYPTPIAGTHIHEFYLSPDDYQAAMVGQMVSAITSVENGHNHHLDLTFNNNTGYLEYVWCGNEMRCWDLHPRILFVTYTPNED